MRTIQSPAKKGSQHWLQILVNSTPDLLDEKIGLGKIRWTSPLSSDDYAEYSDATFLQQLKLNDLHEKLSNFWPNRGPQWDGLGIANDNEAVLVEAKANIPEIFSTCGAKAESSVQKINTSIRATQEHLGIPKNETWLTGFYQYANRLAHLYFLHHLHGIKTHLVFLYVVNDPTHISTSQAEWSGALEVQKRIMNLTGHPFAKQIRTVFIDAHEIEK
jgi:hypothetical protein